MQVLSKITIRHLILDPVNGAATDAYDLMRFGKNSKRAESNPMIPYIAEHKKVAELQAKNKVAMTAIR